MTVRRASSFGDAVAVSSLLRKMHAEGAYSHIPYDDDAATSTVWNVMNWEDGVVFMDEDADGNLVGIMLCTVQDHWFSKTARYASEMALYVDPARRGGLAAARLVRAFKRWAKEKSAHDAIVGVTVGIDNAKAVGLYRALGFSDFGTILKKVV